ncbi:hypothetical protein TSUD_08970 [Trifolium subterraneum]|nr:hypothetical protein TSUD_08970 [Trifolium subterraneum]
MARLLLCQKSATRNHRCKPLYRPPQLCGVSVVGIFCRRYRSISIPRTKAMEKSSQTEEQSQSQSHDSSTSSHDRQNWKTEQNILKEKLIKEDNFAWKLLSSASQIGSRELRYVGGCDISFSKHDPSLACGTLVVLDFHTLEVVYQDFSLVTLNVPYVAGFLAFREAPVILDILEKMKRSDNPFYPQLLMVDGNGILHPRGKCSV